MSEVQDALLGQAKTAERFWTKVNKNGPNGCWEWMAHKRYDGYGQFYVGHRLNGHARQMAQAHRVGFALMGGVIPVGMTLDHLCRNRACVNPAHLAVKSVRDNILAGECPAAINSRKTHCKNGHPFDAANTSIETSGRRRCRACRAKGSLGPARLTRLMVVRQASPCRDAGQLESARSVRGLDLQGCQHPWQSAEHPGFSRRHPRGRLWHRLDVLRQGCQG